MANDAESLEKQCNEFLSLDNSRSINEFKHDVIYGNEEQFHYLWITYTEFVEK